MTVKLTNQHLLKLSPSTIDLYISFSDLPNHVFFNTTDILRHNAFDDDNTTCVQVQHTRNDVTSQFGFVPKFSSSILPGSSLHIQIVHIVNFGSVRIQLYNPASGLKDSENSCLLLRECEFVTTRAEQSHFVTTYHCVCASRDCPLFVVINGNEINVDICEII